MQNAYIPTLILFGGVIGMASLSLIQGSNANNTDPKLITNEHIVESMRESNIDLGNIESVFSFVFSQLNTTVDVYPTENYYYYKFYTAGREIWGNIRLDSEDRKEGKLSFAYFALKNRAKEISDPYLQTQHKNFGKQDGVEIDKIDDLTYDVTYNKKTVRFNLNSIPQTLPEGMSLQEHEVFVERTFDESGFQLVLAYDERKPGFRFILDRTAPMPDVLVPTAHEKVYVGQRSGFTFYKDKLDRLILFGVDQKNIDQNNYYDGPFDQLADNYVKNDTFKNYVVNVFPSLEGKITNRGVFLDEEGNPKASSRLLLSPYVSYWSTEQMRKYATECEKYEQYADVISCLTYDSKQDRPETYIQPE